MALRGIMANAAWPGSCTMFTPPSSRRRPVPKEPSEPVPDRIIEMARSLYVPATNLKNKSIGHPAFLTQSAIGDEHFSVKQFHFSVAGNAVNMVYP